MEGIFWLGLDVFTVESTSSDIRVVERYLMEADEKLIVDFMVRADGNNVELKRVFKRRSQIPDKPKLFMVL